MTVEIGTVLALLALLFGVFKLFFQMKKQFEFQVFIEYTKRYQEIMIQFPEDVFSESFSFEKINTVEKNKIIKIMRLYFDLCSEELFLYKDGKISEKVWNEWKDGMKYSLSKKIFRDSWKNIYFDSSYYSEFNIFIKNLLKNQEISGD